MAQNTDLKIRMIDVLKEARKNIYQSLDISLSPYSALPDDNPLIQKLDQIIIEAEREFFKS